MLDHTLHVSESPVFGQPLAVVDAENLHELVVS